MIEDDLHLLPGAVAAPRRRFPPRQVLLTGATGFVGSHVLARLLAHGDAEVRCLVRAEDAAAGVLHRVGQPAFLRAAAAVGTASGVRVAD